MSEITPPANTLKALRAMTHPARIRMYEILFELKQATVGQMASRAGIAVGSASYHLQQLRDAGLVYEVPGPRDDRREHWWAPVRGGLRWEPSDFLDSPTGREAASAAQLAMSERRIRRLSHWHMTWHEWSPEWINATVESDALLTLTPSELAEMSAELQTVIRSWMERGQAAAAQESGNPSERQRVFAFINAFPLADES